MDGSAWTISCMDLLGQSHAWICLHNLMDRSARTISWTALLGQSHGKVYLNNLKDGAVWIT